MLAFLRLRRGSAELIFKAAESFAGVLACFKKLFGIFEILPGFVVVEALAGEYGKVVLDNAVVRI